MLADPETKDLMTRGFDLVILDGAFPECILGMVYKLNIPFMYINTVGFYVGSLTLAGNPAPYSVTPAFFKDFTDNMNFVQRSLNAVYYLLVNFVHSVSRSTKEFMY